jgi:uncharacterized protein (DUF4415 family)
MKKNNMKPKSKDVILEYTEQDYQEQLAMGVSPDEAIKPGKYKGRRGGFLERHPEFKAQVQQANLLKKHTKVRVSIMLDADIVDFFKAQSQSPNVAKYQTQINNVLRRFIDGEVADQEALLKNKNFIRQLAAEVKEILK